MRILELLLCCVCIMGLTSAMETVYMDQWCGQTYDISNNPATRIKLTASSTYRANMDCTFTVKGDYIYENHIMIQFQDLSVASLFYNDYLEIYDGQDKMHSKIGGRKFRGYNYPSTVYTSNGSSLTFYFKSDGSLQSSGFDIILTHYKTEGCRSYEIHCDNSRCIDSSLACNGYNPCGDHSDCPSTSGTTWSFNIGGVTAAAVGSSIFVVIMIVVAVVVRRRRIYMHQRPVQRITLAIAAPSPSIPPGYNQPVPQQLQIPVTTVQAVTNPPPPPPQGYSQPVPQHLGQKAPVPGVYADQNMTSYPPPPPYSAQ